MDTQVLHPRLQPALLVLQWLAVSDDLSCDIHQLLVLQQLTDHVLLDPLQGSLQLIQFVIDILNGHLPTLLCISNGSLQGCPLAFEAFNLLSAGG